VEQVKIIVVDINGTPHEILEGIRPNFDVLAKWSGNRYLVLSSSEGDLFNPLDINDNIRKRDRERGGMFWKLTTCSQECYQQYTIFLRSRNKTPYLLAQRRFRNDFR
jgi:hypothetical protein